MTRLPEDIIITIKENMEEYNKCLDMAEKMFELAKSLDVSVDSPYRYVVEDNFCGYVSRYSEIEYTYRKFNEVIITIVNKYINNKYNLDLLLGDSLDKLKNIEKRYTLEEFIEYYEEILPDCNLEENAKEIILSYLKKYSKRFTEPRCYVRNKTLYIISCSNIYMDYLDKLFSIYTNDEITPMYNLSKYMGRYGDTINLELKGLCNNFKVFKKGSVNIKFNTEEDVNNIYQYLK